MNFVKLGDKDMSQEKTDMRLKQFGSLISEELNISAKAGYDRAWRACNNGDVVSKQIGRTWLINTTSITEYLKGNKEFEKE